MERLNIVITADPYIPIPPSTYGGIERVIDFLIRGLLQRGHEVTLIAHPDSKTDARLIPFGCPPHFDSGARLRELWQVGHALLRQRRNVDLIHSFGRLAALLPVLPNRRIAKVQSYQRDGIPWASVRRAVKMAGKSIQFTACAHHMFRDTVDGATFSSQWHSVFNGVDVRRYEFTSTVPHDAPLVFLGRIEPIKGTHHAIEVARAAGRRLVIAGNRVDDTDGDRYFKEQVEPHVDGNKIQYVGPVDDAQKNQLLGSAAALLMLIDWEEPFGIVMAEAMACGTPVIGFARGSVPEVVSDGVSGFVVANQQEATQAIGKLQDIDRGRVYEHFLQNFSDDVIVDQYEEIYRELCSR